MGGDPVNGVGVVTVVVAGIDGMALDSVLNMGGVPVVLGGELGVGGGTLVMGAGMCSKGALL